MHKYLSDLFKQTEPLTEAWKHSLQSEGIVRRLDSVPTAVTYRNFLRPGKCCSWNRRSGYLTSVVLTQQRFAVFEKGRKIVNLPFGSEFWNSVKITLRNRRTLNVIANVTPFPNPLSGEVELTFDTPWAQTLIDEFDECLSCSPEERMRRVAISRAFHGGEPRGGQRFPLNNLGTATSSACSLF